MTVDRKKQTTASTGRPRYREQAGETWSHFICGSTSRSVRVASSRSCRAHLFFSSILCTFSGRAAKPTPTPTALINRSIKVTHTYTPASIVFVSSTPPSVCVRALPLPYDSRLLNSAHIQEYRHHRYYLSPAHTIVATLNQYLRFKFTFTITGQSLSSLAPPH